MASIEECGDKKCEGGSCTEEAFVKECEDTAAPDCDDSNRIRTCKSGKFEYQSCGTLTCAEGECQDVFVAECEETFEPVCEENGLKKCVEGKYVTETCGDGKRCKDGACIATAIEDLCPDDPEKGGPGVCDCGVPDVDLDSNGVVDCLEASDLIISLDCTQAARTDGANTDACASNPTAGQSSSSALGKPKSYVSTS